MSTNTQSTKSFLIIDDNQDTLTLMKFMLNQLGYSNIDTCEDHEVVHYINEHQWDFIISDYRMPLINGLDIMKLVHKKLPGTIKILMSSMTDTSIMPTMINEKLIDYYIEKPWHLESLKVCMEKAMSSRLQTQKEAFRKDLINISDIQLSQHEYKESVNRSIVQLIADQIYAHDPVEGRHALNTVSLCTDLCDSLCLSSSDREYIKQLALIHNLESINYKPQTYKFKFYRKSIPLNDTQIKNLYRIPGMEKYAEALDQLLRSHEIKGGHTLPFTVQIVRACILAERSISEGDTITSTLKKLKKATELDISDEIIKALVALLVRRESKITGCRQILIRDLEPGFILTKDIRNAQGVVLLGKGTTLSENSIEKLKIHEKSSPWPLTASIAI